MNTIIWARVSSREQREGYSIDAQLRMCRERAEKNNWTIVREFAIAESAKRGAERHAFNEMMTWVRRHARRDGIGYIIVHKLDRACRNMKDAVRMQELEDECGVRFAFIDNQFGPGAAGALSFNVMAAVGQYYSDNLRGEVLKGMEERFRQGWPMGRVPYGYRNVDDKHCPVVLHPENAPKVVRIFELYATGRYSLESMSRQLTTEFSYQPGQHTFSRNGLSVILNNRAYMGEMERKGVIVKASFQPLVSRTTWEACQHHLNGRNHRTGNPDIPFAGLFRCAVCGSSMSGEVIKKGLKDGTIREHLYYKCANAHPADDHPKVRWTAQRMEDAIIQALESIRMPGAIAGWYRDALTAALADGREADAQRRRLLTKRQTELKTRQDRLLATYLDGVIPEDLFKAKQAELTSENIDVERQLAQPGFDPKQGDLALKALELSQNAVELWRGSKTAVRRELLALVFSNRACRDVSLELEKRKPFGCYTEGPDPTNGWATGIRTPINRFRVCCPTVGRWPSRTGGREPSAGPLRSRSGQFAA